MSTNTIESEWALANRLAACPPNASDTIARVQQSLCEIERLANQCDAEEKCENTTGDLAIRAGFKLSVVIPDYNEEATSRQVLDNVIALPLTTEIIVVDDASTDDTRQVLAECEANRDINVIFKPRNEGKGAALRTAFRRVTGD